MTPEWFEWKYDLCENEIQCDGNTIAYAEHSIFGIKDKEEFNKKLRDLGLRLGWLVERANLATEMLEVLKEIETYYAGNIRHNSLESIRNVIAKAENKQDAARRE
jgi:hypothetical protein